VLVLTAAPSYRCPAAPYEAALLIDDYCRRQGIRDRVNLDFYAAEPGPMGVAGPEVSAAVRGMIQSKGIAYHAEQQVVSVEPGERVARFAGGETVSYDLLVFMPPYRAPQVVRESRLAGAGGWVAVNRDTLETQFPGVYAIGDVTSLPLSMGKPLPKAGVFAHAQGEVVAANIAAAVLGRGRQARFDGHGACFVEGGAGRAGYGAGNFYAEPKPAVRLRGPGRGWHLAKIAYEKYFLWRWA
jgi:sulfide:quinone oxidoreductase